MTDRKLEEAYQQQVERSRLRGEVEDGRDAHERRNEARVQPDGAQVTVGDNPWVYLINVSRAGLAFFTDVAHTPGSRVQVLLDGGPEVGAKVVQCDAELADPAALAGQFRISAEFVDPDAGIQFFLALRDLEAANLDINSD